MIVHVYNPERILNGHSNGTKASSSVNDGNKSSGKSPTTTAATKVPSLTSSHQQEQQVQEKQGFNRPPPSPKMLRQSLFKGPHSRDSQLTSAAPEDEVPSCAPCVAFTHPSSSTTATTNSHNNNNRKLKLRADSSASMDSSSPELDGIASWASARTRQPATAAPHLPSSSSQMASCTCNCSTSANNSAAASGVNVGQEQHPLSPSSLSSSPASGHVRSLESRTDHRETSAASSHYFSPVSSFSNNSGAGVHNPHHDDSSSSNKDPDSLEYKHVRDPSPLVTRKASLDRILSPQVTRRPAYSSSPSNSSNSQTSFFSPVVSSLSTHRDKSLSPVSPAVMSRDGAVIPLANSMSNASIHSNYSEDSLMASSTGARGCHQSSYSAASVGGSPFAGHMVAANAPPPVSQRWNNVHPYDHSGHWIPETGSCMAVEKRPATSTAALAASTASSSLDFSKDSLNSTASGLVAPVTGGGEILHRSSDEQGIGATATATDDVCDDEEDGSESCSIKLEPLAFTIDFGDVSPVKSNKKKETPKRLAERLAASSGQSSSQKRQQQANKAEAAKKSESGASEPVIGSDNNKMLKSLSSRLASPHQLAGAQKFASNPGGGSTSNGGHEVTESSPIGPDSSRRSSAPINKSGGSKTGSASSGSRHSSVGRNNNEHVKTNGLNKKKQSATTQQRQRSPSPPQPVQSPLKSRQANVYNNGSVKNAATAAATVHSHKIGSESLLLLQRSIESDDGHWLSGGDDSKDRPPSPVMTAEYEDEECEERCDDNVSETGTYTIGKDSASPDEDQSRRDIDRIFGLIPQTPTAPISSEGSTAINGQGDTSLDNRSTPQWIREWAAQVAQQQEAPLAHLLIGQVGLSKPPSHPRPPPPDLPTSQRPRRRLPSVPSAVTSNGSSRSRSSPRPSDMSDPSDSSLETESFLRDTESVVSAMQARMDGRSSTESDAETRSSSSYRTSVHQSVLPADLENSIGRKLSAQLRAKIRSLDEPYPITSSSSGVSSSAGRSGSNMLNRETSYVISSSVSGGVGGVGAGVANTVPSSSANMIHNELHGSGGDDSKSLHSDSSLSDVTSGETALRSRQGHLHDDHKSISNNVPAVRYNRALSLRRGRLGLDVEQSNSAPTSASSRTTNKSPSRGSSPHLSQPLNRKLSTASVQSQSSTVSRNGPPSASSNNASSASFSRNDGGRFSLRVGSKTSSSTPSSSARTSRPKVSKSQSGQLQPQGVTGTPPQAPSSGPRKSRSNSTLSSKEAEFQNWKRRKNYDPMKAAAEGKKKEAARRAATGTLTMSQSMIGTVTSSMASSASSQSPSPPPRTIIRSASFTCVNNVQSRSLMDSGDSGHLKYNNNSRRTSHHKQVPLHSSGLLYSSEDENEMLYSPPKRTSPKPSPMTTRKYMGLNPSLVADMSDMMSVTSADVDLISSPGSPRRKAYMDEAGMLMRSSTSNSSLRARTKIEALDNLVISTIHGLSFKIRNNAETLMKKLRPQYVDDLDRLSLIDDSLNRLADCVTESPIHSVAAGRSTSRELSGTLKVMKRVEQVFQALDAVLFEEVMEGAGEEGAILNDGTTTEGEDWNGYTSGDFY